MGIEGRPPTTTTHYTVKIMSSCAKISLLILVAGMAECYVLPGTDYDQDQLLLLNELLDGTDQVNSPPLSEDYGDYSEPLNTVELVPTDEEIVEALLKQIENPAQSEALYEELMKSQGRPSEHKNKKTQHFETKKKEVNTSIYQSRNQKQKSYQEYLNCYFRICYLLYQSNKQLIIL